MSNLKINLPSGYIDLTCKLGYNEDESQQHLFNCEILLRKCEDLANNIKVEYEDIFRNMSHQRKALS